MSAPRHGVSFGEAMRVWARVAALSFGGPAGQIAVMHRIIVEEKKWIGEHRFLQALNYCTLLPGDVMWMCTDGASPDLKHGDDVEVEITGIGVLRTRIVDET